MADMLLCNACATLFAETIKFLRLSNRYYRQTIKTFYDTRVHNLRVISEYFSVRKEFPTPKQSFIFIRYRNEPLRL